ncbi:hypothetical protein K469DRAFT_769306, partial [Zopfia rhizophila CBS 207.26]
EAPQLRVGDKVWLKLKNKKLDWKNAKYTVENIISLHAIKLNTPPGLNLTFHVNRLRLVSNDLLLSQPTDNPQPSLI